MTSLSFTWCTHLAVSCNFYFFLCFYSFECVHVWPVFICLWPLRENATEGWWIPTGGSCAVRTLWENLQDPHHRGWPGRGSHIWCESGPPATTLSVHSACTWYVTVCVCVCGPKHRHAMIQWPNYRQFKLSKDILFGDWCNNRLRWQTVCCDWAE